MPASRTRRSGKKSRGGCLRCKSQHIKCDEAKPECGRCERLALKCPGYATQLKWSTKHEIGPGSSHVTNGSIIPTGNDFDWLEFSLPPTSPAILSSTQGTQEDIGTAFTGVDELTPQPLIGVWNATEDILEQDAGPPEFDLSQGHSQTSRPMLQALGIRKRELEPRLHASLTHQPYELISYYFKVVPSVYSTFDNHKNPFRTAVSGLYSHSLVVNLAAQSMAAAYLADVHPRFEEMGMQLRQQCLDLVQSDSNNNYDTLLALLMSGPTGNWHQPRDLGLTYYNTMRTRLVKLESDGKLDRDFYFFSEAMVLWEMFLAFASDSHAYHRDFSPLPMVDRVSSRREVHPWTGVSGATLRVVADIGRLARANRIRARKQKFITQQYINQMSHDLMQARELEIRLRECEHPDESEIVNTEDNATPVWHITTIAELHRYAGLLQLYRIFPDLLSERLHNESFIHGTTVADMSQLSALQSPTEVNRNEWLRAFSMEALRHLESIPTASGTKDFQPFLLVAFASELGCPRAGTDVGSSVLATFDQDLTIGTSVAEIALMRKSVVDRLTSFCRQIPPKPLRVCLDIIKETWRRWDCGEQNVYWLDVMMENGWETIMA